MAARIFTRVATVDDDAECLQQIVAAAFSSDKNWFNQADIAKDERISTEELRAIIKAGLDPVLVAEVDGVVAGCLLIQYCRNHPEMNLPEDATIFGMLAVHHKYGSMGLGGRLARTALALAVRNGCRKGLIFVLNKRKDLQENYQRKGFKWNGETREFKVTAGEILQPDVWYMVYERDFTWLEVLLVKTGVLDYCIRAPHTATINQVKVDTQQMERGNRRTEVVVDECMHAASY